jgi:formylglycine-generating enzyme required for sulfatase activity
MPTVPFLSLRLLLTASLFCLPPTLVLAQTLPALPPPPVRVVEPEPAPAPSKPKPKPTPDKSATPVKTENHPASTSDAAERKARIAAELEAENRRRQAAIAEQRAAELEAENRRLRAEAERQRQERLRQSEEAEKARQQAEARREADARRERNKIDTPIVTPRPPAKMNGIVLDEDSDENRDNNTPDNSTDTSPVAPAITPLPPRQQLRNRSTPRPGQVFRDCPECPEMIVLPTGEFTIGSEESRNERPQRRVRIGTPLAVGRFEVTFDEWDACVTAGGCTYQPDDEGWGRGRRPAINIGWEDAQTYLRWLSRRTGKVYRLLSESEWEYAARAGSTTRWSFGDEESRLGLYGWYWTNADFEGLARGAIKRAMIPTRMTEPVGLRQPNAFGLFDMHGNVREWVQDCYAADYAMLPPNGDAYEYDRCRQRVVRGGSVHSEAFDTRSAARAGSVPQPMPSLRQSVHTGFRVARSLLPPGGAAVSPVLYPAENAPRYRF